jgi:hypothetical protein
MLGLFFVGLVVSWIATVLVMDGSLKNFRAEKEQLEAKRRAGNTWPGTCRLGQLDHKTQTPTRPADDAREHVRVRRPPPARVLPQRLVPPSALIDVSSYPAETEKEPPEMTTRLR